MNKLVQEARALSRAALNGPWVALCGKSAAAGEMMIRCTSLLPEMADEIERLQAELDALKAEIGEAENAIALIEDWGVVAEPYKGVMDIIDNWKKRQEALAAMKEDAHD